MRRPKPDRSFERWAQRLVVGLAIGTALMIIAWFAVDVRDYGFDAAWLLSWLGFQLVGTYLVARRPENRLSWLLAGIGILIPVGVAGQLAAAVPGSTGEALVTVSEAAFVAGVTLIPLWMLWYPTGRVPTGRWIVAQRAILLLAPVLTTYYVLRPGRVGSTGIINPIGVGLLRPLRDSVVEATAGWAVAMLALVALGSLVGRWRRGEGFERQQLKLVVLPLFTLVLAALVSAVVGLLLGDMDHAVANLIIGVGFVVGMNGVSAGLAIAILRYRLYDIDRAVSRTVTYLLVVGGFGLLYVVGTVWIPARLLDQSTPPLFVAGSTLLVAALFNPARHRIQRWADRTFHRARYDAERETTALVGRLRNQVDPRQVSEEFGHTVQRTVQPASLVLWVRAPVGTAGPGR